MQCLLHGRLQLCPIKIECLGQVVDIIEIFHPSGKLKTLQNGVKFFRHSAFQRIGKNRRLRIALQLRLNGSSFSTRNDHISNPDIHVEGHPDIFDKTGDLRADAVILALQSNGFCLFGSEGHKIVPRFHRQDLGKNRIHSSKVIVQAPHQKIHIHRGAAFKIGERVDKQPAFQDKVFRIRGSRQPAQKFLLEEKL